MKKILFSVFFGLAAFTAFAQDPDVGGTTINGTFPPVNSPFAPGETVTFDIQAGSSSGNLGFPAPGGAPFVVTVGTTRIVNPVVTFTNPNYFSYVITQLSSTTNAQLYEIKITQIAPIPEEGYTTFTITGQAEGTTGQRVGYQANADPGGYNSTNVGQDNPSSYGVMRAPLPVKLVSFTAAKEGATAQLKWVTSQEENADHFNIERSANAKDWNTIGEVAAAGESKTTLSYHFEDAATIAGTNYYRLKMIDKDETFAYSSIKNVVFEGGAAPAVYPNPVSDVVFLKDIDAKNVKEVSIINASGITAYKAASISAAGINVASLTSGIYVVKVTKKDGSLSTHKIVVRK